MQREFKLKNLIVSVVLVIVMFFLSIITLPVIKANAKESYEYTDVLTDLRKSDNFSYDDYSVMNLEYFKTINSDEDETNDCEVINVLTIGEGENRELFIYTYQPLSEEYYCEALSITMFLGFSLEDSDSGASTKNLKFISRSGVYFKYLVDDFTIPNEPCRYYNIVSIHRNLILDIDEDYALEDILDGQLKSDTVAQKWSVYPKNDTLVYEKAFIDVAELKYTFMGNLRISRGFTLGNLLGTFESGDLWFVSFNITNYDVKKIFKATIEYTEEKYQGVYVTVGFQAYWDDVLQESNYVRTSLSSDEDFSYTSYGFSRKEFVFDQICSVDEFKKKCEDQNVYLSDEAVSGLDSGSFVFAFGITEHAENLSTGMRKFSSIIGFQTLTIRFLDIDDDIYELGVVSDIITPDNEPDGGASPELSLDGFFEDVLDNLKEIISILLAVVLLVFLWPFISPIISLIIKKIIKGISFILFWPFKLLFRKRKR